MPNDCLKRLGVRRHVLGIDGRHDDCGVRDRRSEAAVAADHGNDFAADALGVLESQDEIRAHVLLQITAADREDHDGILRVQPAHFEPLRKDRGPSFVVRSRRQLADVVGRRVRFDTGDLTKVVDGVRRIAGAAADAENEKASAAGARLREDFDRAFDSGAIEPGDHRRRLGKKTLAECRSPVHVIGFGKTAGHPALSLNLAGTHVVVTGGSQGIGFACAQQCLEYGARVTIAARTAADLEAARERLAGEDAGDRVHAETCDVASETDVARLFERAAERETVTGAIHAAGVIAPIGGILDVDPSTWWETVKVNLFGTFLVIREAARRMRETGGGRIVALSGGGASNPFPNYTAYASGKVAVVRLVETAAIEFAPFGVEINAIAPGFVATRMHAETLAAGAEAAGFDFFERTKAELERGGISPGIGAKAAAFLVSADARGITGKFIAAQWDGYERWNEHLDELRDTDLFTLRRVLPKDRGLPWQ